ncbi:MAG: ZIP family metal transporter [Candidatus Omnitrophica bacterium]|nr:ZIP family metal transporter [Candidatus Omnitrophota bacterium]
MIWLFTLSSVLVVSFISLIGIFTVSFGIDRLRKMILYMVSFAVGGLFGDAFLHLLPEAFEKLGINVWTSLGVLAGVILFFILEKFLRWQHCHVPTSEDHQHPFVTLNLVGGTVHNLIDGMIIAASYMVSVPVGLATSLAVVFHEIPQEIGHFGILIHGGFSVRKAMLFNFFSALASCLGAFIILVIGPHCAKFSLYLLPMTAGGFLYIAGSDLIPELHQHNSKASASLGQLTCILLGILVMMSLKFIE